MADSRLHDGPSRTELKSKITELETRLKNFTNEKDPHFDKEVSAMEELQARLKEAERERDYERSMKEQLSAQADKLVETVESLSGRLKDADSQYHQLTVKLDAGRRLLREAEAEAERLREANTRMHQDIETLEGAVDSSRIALEQVEYHHRLASEGEMSEVEVVYKLIHFKPFKGYEILGEYETEEEAEAKKTELLERAPKEWLQVARVPRVKMHTNGS